MMEKNRMGMLLFLASEAVFFTVLILAYVYYRGPGVEGPVAEDVLDPVFTGIFTVFLLASSGTLWLAERNIARQRELRARLWLLATVHLGAIFLVGQGWEYFNLFRENVTIDRNLFGSTFFTLTGFHGFHVFAGLVALAILTGMSAAGHFKGPHSVAVETVGLYWHFVDVVWIIIFVLLYVWPFL